VGALGHYLEEQWVATTHISLVREHTEVMLPPRALWVPFMMGRPFGAPNAPEFLRKVLLAALHLLEAESGPVLEDFAEDAPAVDTGEAQGSACPINPSRLNAVSNAEGDLAESLLDEVAQLLPWHDLAIARSGRSTVGITSVSIEESARYVASHLGEPPPPSYDAGVSAAEALKRACDDLRQRLSRSSRRLPQACGSRYAGPGPEPLGTRGVAR
jgi:hypothetical protein